MLSGTPKENSDKTMTTTATTAKPKNRKPNSVLSSLWKSLAEDKQITPLSTDNKHVAMHLSVPR